MTSALEGGHFLHMRENHRTVFDRAGAVGTKNPAVGANVSGSSWVGINSIWQTTPRAFQAGRNGVGQSSSPDQNVSLTRFSASNADDTLALREHDTVTDPSNFPDNVPVSQVENAPSVNRSCGQLLSPTKARIHGQQLPRSEASMSILSNAALLNGSAPDVEPSLSHPAYETHRSMERMEDKLRRLNIAGVHDFVPSQQQGQEKNLNGIQTPQEYSIGFSRDNTPSYADGRSFTDNCRNGFVSSAQYGDRITTTALGDASNAYRQTSYQGGRYGTAALSGGSRVIGGYNSAAPGFSSPYMKGSQNNSWNFLGGPGNLHESFHLGQINTQDHEHRTLITDRRSGSGLHTANVAGPLRTSGFQQYAEFNDSAYLNNRTTVVTLPQDLRFGIHSRSLTPPATESQRSSSGSAQSTQASSQAAVSRARSCEINQPAYSARLPSNGQTEHPQYEYYPSYRSSIPYNDAYIANHMLGLREPGMYGFSEEHADPEKPISAFLKEFKASCKTKRYELKDVYEYIVEFSGDQHGSRFIQGKLETANSDEKEQVFAEIQGNSLQLMTDIFGNYVIQKLFEHGTQAQKKVLANQMKGRVLYLTTQVYGCRVVQKALEHVLTDQQASMVKELEGHVLPIVENQNGNHVIQKAIERVPGEHIQFIVDAHKGQVVRLSKHNYGCRVVQRMLEHGSAPVKRAILAELHESIPSLIVDQFGNYVMQHIIRNGEKADKFRIVSLVQQQLLFFSKHKFASNVVEAAIEGAEDVQRHDILRVLTQPDKNGQSPVYNLIRDQYGNYVIQKVLLQLQGQALESLVHEIKHHLVDLRRVSHGKQVSAMEKALAEAAFTIGSAGQHQGHYNIGRSNNSRSGLHNGMHPRYPPYGSHASLM